MGTNHRAITSWGVLALVLVVGCGKSDQKAVISNTPQYPPAPVAPAVAYSQVPADREPVTEEEARAFAEKFAAAVAAGAGPTNNCFDWPEITARAVGDLGLSNEMFAQVVKDVSGPGSLANSITKPTSQFKAYDCIEVRESNGKQEVVFRGVGNVRFSLSYHVYELHHDEQGNVRIAEANLMSLGDTLSGLLRRVSLADLKEVPEIKSQLSEYDVECQKDGEKMDQFLTLQSSFKFAKARAAYQSLPPLGVA